MLLIVGRRPPSDDQTTIVGLPVGRKAKEEDRTFRLRLGRSVVRAGFHCSGQPRTPRSTQEKHWISPIKHLYAQLTTVTGLGRGTDVGRVGSINIKRRFIATRIPGLVREHQGWRSSDDIGNSVRANESMLKTRKIPRTISALLLVELSIQEFLFDICHFGSCWE